MKDLNLCQFIGRLGKEPEVRFTNDGKAISNLSIACSDDYKDSNGQIIKRTNWVNIIAFGKLAEITQQYLKKGSQVYISGKLTVRKWQDNSGQDRYTTEIVANDMQMLGGGDAANTSTFTAASGQSSSPKPAQSDFDDSIIPF